MKLRQGHLESYSVRYWQNVFIIVNKWTWWRSENLKSSHRMEVGQILLKISARTLFKKNYPMRPLAAWSISSPVQRVNVLLREEAKPYSRSSQTSSFIIVTIWFVYKKNTHIATKKTFMYSQKRNCAAFSPNFHIYVSVSDLYTCIPRICPHIFLQQNRQTDSGNI